MICSRANLWRPAISHLLASLKFYCKSKVIEIYPRPRHYVTHSNLPKHSEQLIDLWVALKEWLFRCQLGKYATDWPYVDRTRISRWAQQHFGCPIPQCNDFVGIHSNRYAKRSAKTEIGNLQPIMEHLCWIDWFENRASSYEPLLRRVCRLVNSVALNLCAALDVCDRTALLPLFDAYSFWPISGPTTCRSAASPCIFSDPSISIRILNTIDSLPWERLPNRQCSDVVSILWARKFLCARGPNRRQAK